MLCGSQKVTHLGTFVDHVGAAVNPVIVTTITIITTIITPFKTIANLFTTSASTQVEVGEYVVIINPSTQPSPLKLILLVPFSYLSFITAISILITTIKISSINISTTTMVGPQNLTDDVMKSGGGGAYVVCATLEEHPNIRDHLWKGCVW